MKLITKYTLFLEALELNENDPDPVKNAKDRLNTYEDNVEGFNKEKKNLEHLVMNAKPGDNIDDKVKNIVGEGDDANNLLSRLLEVLLLQRKATWGKSRLEYYTQLKQERVGDIQATNKLGDEEERAQQIESLNQQIKDIDEKYKSMEDDIKKWGKEAQEKRKELDEYVDDSTEEIEDHIDTLDQDIVQSGEV